MVVLVVVGRGGGRGAEGGRGEGEGVGVTHDGLDASAALSAGGSSLEAHEHLDTELGLDVLAQAPEGNLQWVIGGG